MKSWRWNINGIFCAIALALLLGGCKSSQKKEEKDMALINFHMEAMQDGNQRNQLVPIYRNSPQGVLVRVEPFLNNNDVAEASVVDVQGGFALRIVFDHHGKMVLENYSATQLGRRIAISVAFPEVRWLAAPKISRRISDGVLIFTPDATREEAEHIAKGINAVTKKIRKGSLD